MKAAVITAFDHPPRYGDFAEPGVGPGQLHVDVLAAGLHQLTRGRASGRHYSVARGAAALPFVPGVDGVGRAADGTLRYFVQGPGDPGTMAERTVLRAERSIVLPDGSDPVTVAAAMNPAMASWLALRCRVPFERGQKVLVLGATGNSGGMAVQVARHLGAAQVIAAGRDKHRLAAVYERGATAIVTLDDDRLGAVARDVDVVLDFLWGERAPLVMEAILRQRADRAQPLTWVHVGSMAGDAAPLPGALLRSASLNVVGSGTGSIPDATILRELPALAREVARGTFHVDARAVPLRDVEEAWTAPARKGERIVFTP